MRLACLLFREPPAGFPLLVHPSFLPHAPHPLCALCHVKGSPSVGFPLFCYVSSLLSPPCGAGTSLLVDFCICLSALNAELAHSISQKKGAARFVSFPFLKMLKSSKKVSNLKPSPI